MDDDFDLLLHEPRCPNGHLAPLELAGAEGRAFWYCPDCRLPVIVRAAA